MQISNQTHSLTRKLFFIPLKSKFKLQIYRYTCNIQTECSKIREAEAGFSEVKRENTKRNHLEESCSNKCRTSLSTFSSFLLRNQHRQTELYLSLRSSSFAIFSRGKGFGGSKACLRELGSPAMWCVLIFMTCRINPNR